MQVYTSEPRTGQDYADKLNKRMAYAYETASSEARKSAERQKDYYGYKVKRYALIRNWYNQISYPALKTKREITKYINWRQLKKGMHGKPNEQLFPRQAVISAT